MMRTTDIGLSAAGAGAGAAREQGLEDGPMLAQPREHVVEQRIEARVAATSR